MMLYQKKYLIEIPVCISWWFPPRYILRKQINLIVELNVDCQRTFDMIKILFSFIPLTTSRILYALKDESSNDNLML